MLLSLLSLVFLLHAVSEGNECFYLLTLFAPATECAKRLTVTLMAVNVLLKPRAHLERV